MDKVGFIHRLKNQVKWYLLTRRQLPSKVRLEAVPSINLQVQSLATGNIVLWSKKRYGMHDDMLRYEPPETELFLNLVQGVSVFYDVGAHIGYYSLIAASYSNVRHIVAFEALDSFADEIKFHANNNGFKNITVVSEPLGDGIVDISFGNHASFFKKKSVSLDHYVDNNQLVPELIKMDIEGYEYYALRGAQHTIKTHKPDLLLSIHPRYVVAQGNDLGELYKLIHSLYEYIYLVNDDGLIEERGMDNLLERIDLSVNPVFNNCSLYCSSKSLSNPTSQPDAHYGPVQRL